jgi:pimeloyl-ACP methyl ester carboxylesterase
MTSEVYIGGHSLGAAEAYEYAFSRIRRGLRVDGIYCLAPPRPGDSVLASALLAAVPVARALRNRRDIVPSVPVDIAWLNEEYVQPYTLEEVDEKPTTFGLFADHSITLYAAGAQKLKPLGVSVEIGEAATQIARLYTDAAGWDWISTVDGRYWAMKVMPSGAKLMIRRGSVSVHDWLDDFNAIQIPVLGARVSQGFWSGVAPIELVMDQQLA